MPFDEQIADRIREKIYLMGITGITEKKMFGGLSFLYFGKMSVGVVGEDLAVRVLEKKYLEWVEKPHIRPMDFTKRPMKEFIFVAPPGYANDKQLEQLILLGIEHAESKQK